MNRKLKSQLITFRKNGKKYQHYKTHKANSRNVSKDLYKKDFLERTEEVFSSLHGRIFASAFNMGYECGWERDNEVSSDSCLNCKVKLGFRGYCSKKCHKEHKEYCGELKLRNSGENDNE